MSVKLFFCGKGKVEIFGFDLIWFGFMAYEPLLDIQYQILYI